MKLIKVDPKGTLTQNQIQLSRFTSGIFFLFLDVLQEVNFSEDLRKI